MLLAGFLAFVMRPSSPRTEILAAFRQQARALDAVWEAYRRGAAQLPDGVASGVERALVKVPRILGGAPTRMTSVA